MERMPSPHELDPNIPLEVSQTIMKAMEFIIRRNPEGLGTQWIFEKAAIGDAYPYPF